MDNAHEAVRPARVQRRRVKGWKMPPNTISVTRPFIFGNPFPVDCYGPEKAVDLFRRWLTGQMSAREMSQLSRCDRWSIPPGVSLVTVRRWLERDLSKLRGKSLACWCRLDQPCHADVLIELANRPRCEAVALECN